MLSSAVPRVVDTRVCGPHLEQTPLGGDARSRTRREGVRTCAGRQGGGTPPTGKCVVVMGTSLPNVRGDGVELLTQHQGILEEEVEVPGAAGQAGRGEDLGRECWAVVSGLEAGHGGVAVGARGRVV